MIRQSLFVGLCALSVAATGALARSASASPFLYMSTNLQGYAYDPINGPQYGTTGPVFPGDANTVGGVGSQAGVSYAGGPAWNQAFDAAKVFQTPTPTPNGWTYGGIGGANTPVNYPGDPGYIAPSNAQYDNSNTLTSVTMAINVNPPSFLNTSGAPSTLFDNEIGTNASESAPGVLSLFNVPAGVYTLYAYTSGNTNGYDGELAVNGSTWQEAKNGTVGAQSTLTDYIQATAGTGNVGNYVIFNGVVPVSGEIDIAIASATFGTLNSPAYLDGFQLVNLNVPEPSSFVLAGIGLVGTAVITHRRRRK